jgi:hypothetical protein
MLTTSDNGLEGGAAIRACFVGWLRSTPTDRARRATYSGIQKRFFVDRNAFLCLHSHVMSGNATMWSELIAVYVLLGSTGVLEARSHLPDQD